MIKYYESLLLYEKSILVILEAVYSSRFIKVLRPYLNVTRVLICPCFQGGGVEFRGEVGM